MVASSAPVKCRKMQRNGEKCKEMQRNAEKSREMQTNVEKCREMQRMYIGSIAPNLKILKKWLPDLY